MLYKAKHLNISKNSVSGRLLLICMSVVALLCVGGCDLVDSGDDGPAVELGIIAWETNASSDALATAHAESREPYTEDFEALTAPDTVWAGESFEVDVRTVGPTGCYEADRVETEQETLLVEVTPYDLDPTDAETTCPDQPVVIRRTLDFQFDTPGDGLIRLNGQRVIGNDFSNRDETVIEHELMVVE